MSGSKLSAPGALGVAERSDPVGLTVHAVTPPDAADASRRTARGRLLMLAVLLVCATPVILSYLTYFVIRPSQRNNYATLVQPTVTMPKDLPLHKLLGEPVAASSLKGQWLLVVVSGGQCDATCEALLFEQRQLREMTGREKERVDRIWLVVDDAPLRDPIARAVQNGEGGMILRLPRAAASAWLQPEAGHRLEEHLYLVDPMGEWMMRTPANPDPMKFKRDLDRLLRASEFWDRPGRPLP